MRRKRFPDVIDLQRHSVYPMEEFGAQIYVAVRSGKLKEPFNAAMAKKACPGWPEKTYHAFFSEHAIANPEDNTPLFVRERRGLLSLNVGTPKTEFRFWA